MGRKPSRERSQTIIFLRVAESRFELDGQGEPSTIAAPQPHLTVPSKRRPRRYGKVVRRRAPYAALAQHAGQCLLPQPADPLRLTDDPGVESQVKHRPA